MDGIYLVSVKYKVYKKALSLYLNLSVWTMYHRFLNWIVKQFCTQLIFILCKYLLLLHTILSQKNMSSLCLRAVLVEHRTSVVPGGVWKIDRIPHFFISFLISHGIMFGVGFNILQNRYCLWNKPTRNKKWVSRTKCMLFWLEIDICFSLAWLGKKYNTTWWPEINLCETILCQVYSLILLILLMPDE